MGRIGDLVKTPPGNTVGVNRSWSTAEKNQDIVKGPYYPPGVGVCRDSLRDSHSYSCHPLDPNEDKTVGFHC